MSAPLTGGPCRCPPRSVSSHRDQLRAVPGPDDSADDANTLHIFTSSDPRAFLTGAGFAIAGAAMTWKLIVRLTTGNEAGSDAVTVTRPL